MAVVEEAPYVPVHVVDPPQVEGVSATKRELMSALFALAKNNPDFQRGKLDHVGFELNEADRIEDYQNPDPVESLRYAYGAQRRRTPDSRPAVDFIWSVTAKLTDISLPPNVAEEIYRARSIGQSGDGFSDTLSPTPPADQLVRSFGNSFAHEITYGFEITHGESERELGATEEHTYRDRSGDVVHCVSVENDTDNQDLLEQISRGIAQLDTFSTVEQIREFWGCYELVESVRGGPTGNEEQTKIDRGYGLLLRVRRALLIQAGIHKIGGTVLLDTLAS